MTTPTASIAYSAYQPPTGQVLAHILRGPQPATSPLSQLSLDFSEHKPSFFFFSFFFFFIRKPEAPLWQSRGTARDWPLCIFSSSLAVAHPDCRGCQSLACAPPAPTSLWLCSQGVTRGAGRVPLITRFQVKSCFWSGYTSDMFGIRAMTLFSCNTWRIDACFLDTRASWVKRILKSCFCKNCKLTFKIDDWKTFSLSSTALISFQFMVTCLPAPPPQLSWTFSQNTSKDFFFFSPLTLSLCWIVGRAWCHPEASAFGDFGNETFLQPQIKTGRFFTFLSWIFLFFFCHKAVHMLCLGAKNTFLRFILKYLFYPPHEGWKCLQVSSQISSGVTQTPAVHFADLLDVRTKTKLHDLNFTYCLWK